MTAAPSVTGIDPAFPWGSNEPSLRARIAVALAVALVAAVLHYFRAAEVGGNSDFAAVWEGARAMINGDNPYVTIGPGRKVDLPWPTRYPAPAFVAALPLLMVPLHAASTVFTLVSAGLLAFGATSGSWHRLPALASIAFFTSAQLAQWSLLYSAALFLPFLACVSVVKPPTALPILASAREPSSAVWAFFGATVFTASSFWLMPGWPSDWLDVVRASDNFKVPITLPGGSLIALVLLKWRRPEAWLVFVAACTPQTSNPYNSLVLLFVAATYREACVLSLLSSVSWLAMAYATSGSPRGAKDFVDIVHVAACFLPVTIAILRRPNNGPEPWWLGKILRWRARVILRFEGR